MWSHESVRVIVFATGSFGDVYPLIGLSRRLSRSGHDVVFVTNEHFRDAAEAESLRFVASGSDRQYMDILNDPRL